MTKDIISTGFILAYTTLLAAAIIGWGMNIYKIFTMSWDVLTVELIIRIVGVPVAIIGAVAGWF